MLHMGVCQADGQRISASHVEAPSCIRNMADNRRGSEGNEGADVQCNVKKSVWKCENVVCSSPFCGYMIDTTAWNGLSKVRNAPHGCMRLLWLLLLITCSVVMIWRLALLVEEFCSWPVQTTVSLQLKSHQMPAVTFCNINPIRQSRLANLSCELQHLFNSTSPECQNVENTLADAPVTGLDDFLDMNRKILHEIVGQDRDALEAAGHQIEDMLLRCTFAGNNCFTGNMSSYFRREWTMDYGNCYTMNTSSMRFFDSGGPAGMDLYFDVQTEESLTAYLTGYGIRVVVHEPGTQPFPSGDGLAVGSGCQAYFSLRVTEVSRLGGKYGDCSPDDPGDDYVYSTKTCHARRFEERQLEVCNCTDPFSRTSTPSRDAPICDTDAEFSCNVQVSEEFNEVISGGHHYRNCFNPCRETMYKIRSSSRKWPLPSLLPVLEAEVCRHNPEGLNQTACMAKRASRSIDERLSSFLRLRIYLESLSYERITEEPFYEIDRFLSDLGGMIGLFLGASALGMFEIIELLILVPLGRWIASTIRSWRNS